MNSNKRYRFYVVYVGHKTGIFDKWSDCQQQTHRYSNADFKGFHTYDRALKAYQRYRGIDSNTKSFVSKQQLSDKGFFAVLVGWKEGVYLSRREARMQTAGCVGQLCEEYNTYDEAVEALDLFFATLFKYNLPEPPKSSTNG